MPATHDPFAIADRTQSKTALFLGTLGLIPVGLVVGVLAALAFSGLGRLGFAMAGACALGPNALFLWWRWRCKRVLSTMTEAEQAEFARRRSERLWPLAKWALVAGIAIGAIGVVWSLVTTQSLSEAHGAAYCLVFCVCGLLTGNAAFARMQRASR